MAEAAVVRKVTEDLTSILVSKLFHEVSLLTGFREDFEFLCEELISIKALLNDAGDKRNSTSVSSWLDKLEEFLLDAVDIVEECGAAHNFNWNPILRYKMGRRINVLKKRINQIHRSTKYLIFLTSVLHVNERMQINNAYNSQAKREISDAIIQESQTVGMEHQIRAITELIWQEDGRPVIAIVGIGGLGKTLLLQHVFNTLQVREGERFDHMVWLPVSQKFSINRLWFEIFKQLSNDQKDIEEMEKKIIKEMKKISTGFYDQEVVERKVQQELTEKIHKHLEGKRSLFAIDDVWDEHVLRKIELLLGSGDQIKIVITTRDRKVGEVMSNSCIYEMKGLSKENSRKLFCIHSHCPESPSEKLSNVLNRFVDKCSGLPLALKTIGSYMARVSSEDWERNLHRLSETEPMAGNIMPSLKLSYEALSDHVKPCFLYCSGFSKNTHIKSECLVHAWIAAGFISTSTKEAAEDAYDVGCSYLDELIDLCLIEVSQVGGDGRVKYCKMHDLLHDFALSESLKQSKCLLEPGGEMEKLPVERCMGLRKISLIKNNISTLKEAIQSPGLRTLMLSYNYSLTSSTFFNNLRYLTVLDLNRTLITELPVSIGNLKFLKFLNLSGTFISMLPKSMSRLRHLQFLDLSYCRKLKRLHSGIGHHKFLRYLNAKGCPRLTSLPAGISKLISLQTLKGANVFTRKQAANANVFQWRHFRDLTLLQHLSLKVSSVADVTSSELEGVFQGMTSMRTLEVIYKGLSPFDLPKDMEVMERLEIVHLCGCVLPKWIFQLKNLKELKSEFDWTSDYRGLEKIPNLSMLHLSGNENCVEFPEEFGEAGAFPKLQKFSIIDFQGLEKFTPLHDGANRAMPNLKYLRIKGCDRLEYMPERFEGLKSIAEEQDLDQCDLPSKLERGSAGAVGFVCVGLANVVCGVVANGAAQSVCVGLANVVCGVVADGVRRGWNTCQNDLRGWRVLQRNKT